MRKRKLLNVQEHGGASGVYKNTESNAVHNLNLIIDDAVASNEKLSDTVPISSDEIFLAVNIQTDNQKVTLKKISYTYDAISLMILPWKRDFGTLDIHNLLEKIILLSSKCDKRNKAEGLR